MKTLALGALLAGFLAACGGGGSGDDVVPAIDARTDATNNTIDAGDTTDAPVSLVCDPIAPPGMQGCAANEKCTWIRVQTTPTIIGALGCVPDGTVALGGTCTRGADGQTTGYDTCVAGSICIGPATGGVCQDICGFDGSAAAACATGQACTRYQNTFANSMEDPIAGACNPKCDPVTQLRDDNSQACPMGQGCYTLTSTTETNAVCARTVVWDMMGTTLGHNDAIPGTASANACRPFHTPRRTAPGATTFECGALCVPNDVSQNLNVGDEGGVGNHTCADLNAPPPETVVGGESCRYFWAREQFSGTTLSPFSNTLGFCWDHTLLWYDSNNDMTGDMKTPRCITLATGSDTLPPTGLIDPLRFWCIKMPMMLTGAFGHSNRYLAEMAGNTDTLSPE